MMFWLMGTDQEAGAGGRSGPELVSLFTVHWWGVFLDIAASTFLSVHFGSLVSTLVLSNETECPVS